MDLGWLENRIKQAPDVETALRGATSELCKAFNADRFTVYRTVEDGKALSAMIQAGLESFGTIKVRLDANHSSLAGYVGDTRKIVNIANAYDHKELAPLRMGRKMFVAVDERTGYLTRQVLAAPVLSPSDGKLVGVVEIINNLDKKPFSKTAEKDVVELCQAIARALEGNSRQ